MDLFPIIESSVDFVNPEFRLGNVGVRDCFINGSGYPCDKRPGRND
jgi:hypothetical protein